MDRFGLKDGIIVEAYDEDWESFEADKVFYLDAEGIVHSDNDLQSDWKGKMLYKGDFYIEPLEIGIDFIKADNAKKWLQSLLLRHTERVRHIASDLCILAEMKEAEE